MSTPALEIRAEPLTTRCARPLHRAEHACLGISPFNSYFSTERITALLAWADQRFDTLHLFIPDRAAAHTLEALGYPPERARHKARRQARYLRNKIDRALEQAGLDTGAGIILDAAALDGRPQYAALLEECHARYASDTDFRDACLDASRWVLHSRAGTHPTPAQQHAAVPYFLAELPLFLDTPSIVGADSSVFCYHNPPEFLRALYSHELSCTPHPHQGFATVVTPATAGQPAGTVR